MSQRLPQKKSNKFLQQPLPENLIANKPLGKREKQRPKGGVIFQNYSRMERDIRNNWLFSWSRSLVHPHHPPSTERSRFCAPVERVEAIDFPRKKLIAPPFHLTEMAISRAVGGKLVEHFNDLNSSPAQDFVESSRPPRFSETSSKFPPLPPPELYAQSIEKGLSSLSLSAVPYSLGVAGELATAADLVCKRIGENLFTSIYSLNERARLSSKGDKFSHDYRNQLAERRKIALLYGNLSKKTLVRLMRRAKDMRGGLDFNFLSLLEKRLDVALKRASFFSTIRAARHWIHHGRILVNNQITTVPSYQLQPGDVITVAPGARSIWKKQCTQLVATIARAGGKRKNAYQNSNNKTRGQASIDQWGAGGNKLRRFSPSPSLMEKLHRWSKLWGNSPSFFPKHQWAPFSTGDLERSAFFRELLHLHSSTKSGLANYLLPERKRLLTKSLSLLHRCNTAIAEERILRSRFLKGAQRFKVSSFPRQARWLHQQQAHVVDGLYPYRWNKLFIEKKTLAQRINHWRYSCIKPLHLECSYQLPCAIFLYAPQKLAWSSSINLHLLRKSLL